jgi:Putative lumazine-binding
MILKGLVFIFFFSAGMLPAFSQSEEVVKEVMEPIKKLFDGMHQGDSAMAHSAFAKEVTLSTVTEDKSGTPVLRSSTLQGFLQAIGKPHTEVWSEMIWDPEVRVDGNFAQVWVKYAFYAGKTFSHCGIDAFHLVKNQEGHWKIFHLADTRHKENCDVPKSISDQFK